MDDEQILIARIISGDQEAWTEFLGSYSALIQKTIARFVRNEEVARDLYATLLQKLRNGKLERFDYRSKLSTWLFVVARNHCRDYYRSTKGVRCLMTAIEGLGRAERRFFTLYYVERLSLPQVFQSMRLEFGNPFTYLGIADCMETIRRTLAQRKLGRMVDRLLRPDVEFIYQDDYERAGGPESTESIETRALWPDATAQHKVLQGAVENLRDAILRLPHRDQLILQLRFEHKLSARKIGQILDMGNEKQVYRKLGRLYEELRTMLLDTDMSEDEYCDVVEDIENLCRLSASYERRIDSHSGSPS
jgi:DNA-directed RNA polymerase specialized sigma24 family protein